MDIKGEAQIPADLKTVWAGLNSTDVLLKAIPGCESIERISENELQAKVMIKLGPVTARFSGKVSMTDIRPLEGYTLHFEGSGGAAGFAKGSAEIHLQETSGETRLTYNAKASIGGKLGQLGSRLIEGSARKLSADFFASFAQAVAPGRMSVTALTEDTSAGPMAAASASPSNAMKPRLMWWLAAAAAALAITVSLYGR